PEWFDHESGPTFDWSLIARKLGESLKEGKQMTGKTGAPSHCADTWDSINWTNIEKQVKRLQVRIAKATKEGRFGKVKSLQWILSHSYHAKLSSVKRVTENQGGKTPGVDGKVLRT